MILLLSPITYYNMYPSIDWTENETSPYFLVQAVALRYPSVLVGIQEYSSQAYRMEFSDVFQMASTRELVWTTAFLARFLERFLGSLLTQSFMPTSTWGPQKLIYNIHVPGHPKFLELAQPCSPSSAKWRIESLIFRFEWCLAFDATTHILSSPQIVSKSVPLFWEKETFCASS